MIEIMLVDFVDFIVTAGPPQLTKVRDVKHRGEYAPAKDFWKRLREAIQAMHRDGLGKAHLDHTLAELTDQKKEKLYPIAISGYRRFLGRKQITWFDPPGAEWAEGELSVRINPELGLCINGVRYVIKLYFKKAPISKNRVECALHLMHVGLPAVGEPYQVAIVDVPNGKLIVRSDNAPDLTPLLRGEAAAFVGIWNALA
jgi:hypothetical protein